MKKLAALCLGLLYAAAFLAACADPETAESTASASAAEVADLGLAFTLVLPMVPTEEWTFVQQGFEDACGDLHIEPTVVMSSLPMDMDQIDGLVLEASGSSDGILLYPVADDLPSLAAARQADVPFVFLMEDAAGAGRFACVKTDPESMGALLAQAVADRQAQPIYIAAGSFASDSFAQAALETLEGQLSAPAAVIDSGDAQQTQEQYRELLAQNPGVNALVNFSDFGAGQALAAAQDLGREGQLIVGWGLSDATLAGIAEGTIAATACQNYYKMGYDGVSALYRHYAAQAQPIQEPLDAGALLITQANIDTYRDEVKATAGLPLPEAPSTPPA